jgi:transcriptional regulator with XRE-family HTH domain
MTPAAFRRIRHQQALTQSELADLLGVHLMTVSRIERGTMPASVTIAHLMHALATGWRPPPTAQ